MESDPPCLLVPHGAERARVYVCVPVDACLAHRSSVVESLLHTQGYAELPEGINVEDFLGWSNARPDEAGSIRPEDIRVALEVRCSVAMEAVPSPVIATTNYIMFQRTYNVNAKPALSALSMVNGVQQTSCVRAQHYQPSIGQKFFS